MSLSWSEGWTALLASRSGGWAPWSGGWEPLISGHKTGHTGPTPSYWTLHSPFFFFFFFLFLFPSVPPLATLLNGTYSSHTSCNTCSSVYTHGMKPQDHGVYLLYGLVHTNYALSLDVCTFYMAWYIQIMHLDVETWVHGIPFMPCMYLSNWLLVGEIKVRRVGPRPTWNAHQIPSGDKCSSHGTLGMRLTLHLDAPQWILSYWVN